MPGLPRAGQVLDKRTPSARILLQRTLPRRRLEALARLESIEVSYSWQRLSPLSRLDSVWPMPIMPLKDTRSSSELQALSSAHSGNFAQEVERKVLCERQKIVKRSRFKDGSSQGYSLTSS